MNLSKTLGRVIDAGFEFWDDLPILGRIAFSLFGVYLLFVAGLLVWVEVSR